MLVRWKLVLLRAVGEILWFVKDLSQREPGRESPPWMLYHQLLKGLMTEAIAFSDMPLFLWRAENLHKAECIFIRKYFFAFRYLRHTLEEEL